MTSKRCVALGLFAVILALAGCSYGDGDTKGETNLTVHAVTFNSDGPAVVEVSLRCNPAEGTVDDPAAACRAIEEHPAMLFPPEMTGTCAGSEGVPPEISVDGVAGERTVNVDMRNCDAPTARAEAANLWMGLLGIPPPRRR